LFPKGLKIVSVARAAVEILVPAVADIGVEQGAHRHVDANNLSIFIPIWWNVIDR
jgi:hypothetical protein